MIRFGYLLAAAVAVIALGGLPILSPTPTLIWNTSASAPVGLYTVGSRDDLAVGEWVAVAPPAALAAWLERRGYLPRGVPLIKRIAARPGQRVCRHGAIVSIDGKAVARAQARDRRGRVLPRWAGCRRLADGMLFLLNRDHPDSLDGRYFGPVSARAVLGRVRAIYTDDDADGHYDWHGFGRDEAPRLPSDER